MTGHFPVVKMFIAIPFQKLHLPKHGEKFEIPGCQGTRYLSDL